VRLAKECPEKEIYSDERPESEPAHVTFLGLWDMVPVDVEIMLHEDLHLRIPAPWTLVVHATAIHERRGEFQLVRMTARIPDGDICAVINVWFPGSHSNV
jgi:hypothetical protein